MSHTEIHFRERIQGESVIGMVLKVFLVKPNSRVNIPDPGIQIADYLPKLVFLGIDSEVSFQIPDRLFGPIQTCPRHPQIAISYPQRWRKLQCSLVVTLGLLKITLTEVAITKIIKHFGVSISMRH